jgi:hypothetical protein
MAGAAVVWCGWAAGSLHAVTASFACQKRPLSRARVKSRGFFFLLRAYG